MTIPTRSRLRSAVAVPALVFALLLAGPGCDRPRAADPATAGGAETNEAAEAAGAAGDTTARAGAAGRELAPSGAPYSEARTACRDRDPNRQVFFGELHVHSTLSMDAWLWDVRGGPDDVYRFGRGEEVLLPPLDAEGRGTRPVKLERPLDFVALTDHADFQGEVSLCTRPGSPAYDTPTCRKYRGEDPDSPSRNQRMGLLAQALHPGDAMTVPSARSATLCGPDGAICRDAMKTVWEEQQAAAERHYDRTADCRFTTFNAYEYTATPGLAKVHHNVIFRNENVPKAPIPWIDVPDVYDLWSRLSSECLEAGTGCDVVTLPHNSNLSNGNMFAVTGRDLPLEDQRARAMLRADIERLAEISQIKGDSECRNGMWNVLGATDEFCDYEQWRGPEYADCRDGTGKGALFDQGCVGRSDFLRYALLEGLREQARLGVNPFKTGFVAATDTHNATPSDVEEYSYDGWGGMSDATATLRLEKPEASVTLTYPARSNPGGIAGVWAEENSRDAIFDAMKRRETFGTSGPRMTARFFGGWNLPGELCAMPDLVERGYASGVPMGGDLPARPEGTSAPSFVVSALRDVGIADHPGGLLQRVQIVKGWVDAEDKLHQAVYDVAGGPNDASVDPATCEPRGTGAEGLCAVWTDPEFDPDRSAVYYVRVLENPSCRWTARQCLALPADRRPEACRDPAIPTTIQERLWTSPIWYDAPAPSPANAEVAEKG
ncbi:MAG: DUF3604 domain-containing protein [Deltaproteobacteria bacterium]|nr:DUF3604 domain-containing protein [Deltaproteobacteria bacterium]